ncbi:MAG TPA: CRTAC1 family protein, partial [Planctomycetaceae bacterium]
RRFTIRPRPFAAGALLALFAAVGCSDRESGAPAASTSGTAKPLRPAAEVRTASDRPAEPPPETLIRFEDRTREAGVDFIYRSGEEAGHFSILESLGGGAGLIDFDLDGAPDLVLPGGGEYGPGPTIRGLPPALYRNLGSWRYVEVAGPAGLRSAPYYSHGPAVADYDADGFPDLVITGYGGLVLFRNQGDGTFVEETAAAGMTDGLWSSSAAWGDFDGDANLDLYVAHYVDWSFDNHPFCPGPTRETRDICSPRRFQPLPDTLYVSNGDGTFRDASDEAGLRVGKGPEDHGKGLGVVTADLDLDGDLDVYVTNDTVPNFLYRNDGAGRFEEVALMSGTALSDRGVPDGSMGVDVGDFNLDGRPDIWVANYERESIALYRNEGNGFYQHTSQATGVTAVGGLFVGWGTVFCDFDRDGDQDTFVSNGHVIRFPDNATIEQLPLLFENKEGRRFVNVAPAAGEYMTSRHRGRGVAMGDLDGDGRVDLVSSRVDQPAVLLANASRDGHHWLGVRLIGTRSPRDPIGAVVRVRTARGTQMRQFVGGGSYASTNDRRLYLGLGTEGRVERLEIDWPSGARQVVENVPADAVVTVREIPNDAVAAAE